MSKRYQVYGIGNALVDVQYRVEPEFLARMRLDKGVMTLVDETRQEELMAALEGRERKRSSGGSAANTLIGLAQLGGKAFYACKVGRDEMGDFFLTDLERAGVACNRSHRGDGATGRCLVLITPDADRTMCTFLGITSTFGPQQIDEPVIVDSDYLYIEGYLLTSDEGFAAARHAQTLARAAGTRVALTLSDPFVVQTFAARIAELLGGGVDLLFCNADEARALTGETGAAEAAAALAGQVPRVVITCGAEGALVRDGSETFRAAGRKVEAIDTNGAGDMFAGAFLYALTHGHPSRAAADLANFASSRVVSQIGARLEAPLGDEAHRLLSG